MEPSVESDSRRRSNHLLRKAGQIIQKIDANLKAGAEPQLDPTTKDDHRLQFLSSRQVCILHQRSVRDLRPRAPKDLSASADFDVGAPSRLPRASMVEDRIVYGVRLTTECRRRSRGTETSILNLKQVPDLAAPPGIEVVPDQGAGRRSRSKARGHRAHAMQRESVQETSTGQHPEFSLLGMRRQGACPKDREHRDGLLHSTTLTFTVALALPCLTVRGTLTPEITLDGARTMIW